ncbi:hypothetical protein AQUCO_01400951v1 [Aquilegia coerulea]|uniref:Late embryogenesis abundant protein LEA-2 subgroup domain-containing protein n=1 Tax=Aquilegia coerulea TaxID=218851 RepID=A0A2G5DZP2_AQUCA|nr:hypothetical protein AQUCO_01400951v1 [Aquilegia coerulea]
MADRIHPRDFSPTPSPQREEEVPLTLQVQPQSVKQQPPPATTKPPAPGTYVIQLPKEQIFRYPPPPHLLPKHNKQQPASRNRCCCCFCWLISLIILLLVLVAISVGIFFIIYRPKSPKYSVDNLSIIQGFNLTSTSSSTTTVSPKVDVTVTARNPNTKLSIYYIQGSFISLSLSDNPAVDLCTGVLPVYYQPTKNVTIFKTALTGSSDVIQSNRQTLYQQQSKGKIPLRLNLKVPVRIKFGSIKTWTIPVKVRCDITVDKLTVDASIVSNKCDVDVKPWE